MNHLDAALAARAFREGKALRTARLRHRRLIDGPMAIVLWQLGAEPFSAAAVGYGCSPADRACRVAGEPRSRDLAFQAVLPFARWFNERFERHAASRETVTRGNFTFERARTAPQVIVANSATAEMLGRLGRRLAYLPTSGPRPAEEALVRLGRHLLFLRDRRAVPGQQLLVAMTELLGEHWATPQSELEQQSLPALDAWIEPPAGLHGFEAAARVEDLGVGPVPSGDEDERLGPLVERFNQLRGKGTDPAMVRPLLAPVYEHYKPLLLRAWELLWRCRDREAVYPEAPSVARRWDEDRDAYTRHMDWMARSGLRRTRQTPRQAALTLRSLEEATRLLEAEEACDDPLRMLPCVLENKAVRGMVERVDRDHKELAKRKAVRRPLVVLCSDDPCRMPAGKKLYWSEDPGGKEFLVHRVEPLLGGGARVTLKLMTSRDTTGTPAVGMDACFSVHHTARGRPAELPRNDPWTHRPATALAAAGPIEDE
jgi:hypothetical protein